MTGPATTAEPPSQPGAPHQAPAQPATLPRIVALLGLLQFLIGFGTDLATRLERHGRVQGFRQVNMFGSDHMPTVMARIIRGLLRAAALQQLLHRRAASGRDIQTPPIRKRPPRAPGTAPQPPPHRVARTPDPDALLRPTPKQLAAEVRRRHMGAVLTDICDDLGLTPGLVGGAHWDVLCHAIAQYGGNLGGFLKRVMRRGLRRPCPAPPVARSAPPPPPLLPLPVPSTGPP